MAGGPISPSSSSVADDDSAGRAGRCAACGGIGDAGRLRSRRPVLRETLRGSAAMTSRPAANFPRRIADRGDVEIAGLSIEQATGPSSATRFSSAPRQHELTLLVGGNNAVTRPGVLGLGVPLADVGPITLDAHFDMRDTHEGLSNGNPVRALIEDGLPGANIAQIGLATFANSRKMHDDAHRGGQSVITIGEIRLNGDRARDRARSRRMSSIAMRIVVDCDIDVIDRSQLPGAPGARPAAWWSTDFFKAVRYLATVPRGASHRSHRVGSAARSDRSQRADRSALGRRVPRRVRGALEF